MIDRIIMESVRHFHLQKLTIWYSSEEEDIKWKNYFTRSSNDDSMFQWLMQVEK